VRKHYLTFLLLVLLGCKDEKIPEGILNIEQMTSILIDVHIAEGKIVELVQKPDTAAIIMRYFEDEIFMKHNVEREVYEKSFKYHLTNITSLNDVYARVVDSLNLRKEVQKLTR